MALSPCIELTIYMPDVILEERCEPLPQANEFLTHALEFVVAHMIEIDKPGPGASRPAEKLIELQLDDAGRAVLSVLDDEDHQKGHDRRAGIDHQLPTI